MRLPAQLIGLLVIGGVIAGCSTHAEPLLPSSAPELNAPEPPPRVVVPAADHQTLPLPPEEEPPSSGTASPPSKPPVRNPNPKPATTAPTEPVPPPVTPPTPAILLTSANSPEFEKRVRDRLLEAENNLAQVNPKNLGTDAKAHFNAAKGFIRQAEEALKVKNLIYAGQLADKAATMAALLRK